MPEPRTAEEHVALFRNAEMLLFGDTERDELLIRVLQSYARQVGEAVKEKCAQAAEQLVEGNRKYAATSSHDGGAYSAGRRIANAIRARALLVKLDAMKPEGK